MTPALAADLKDPTAAAPGIPQRIGRFQIRAEIGRGSNGVVYSASDPVLGREVAIKAIPLGALQAGKPDVEAGFLQEAKIAAGLNHASIVTVFDAGKTESIAYIAMERLHGADLHHWLAANGSMAPEAAAALIARVCDAVHFAHRRGLIHRDIKPSNIFLGRDMKPKVLDFGIALAQGQQVRADEPRKLIGTPNYMSPEQALGRALDARSDVFSIGAILYELITGQRAFDGATVDEILTKVVKTEPESLTEGRPEVSPVMAEIVARALAKDPAQRYQTAGQLRNDLAAFAGRPAAPATSPPGDLGILALPRPGVHWPGPAALLATGGALLVLSLSFGLWYWSHRDDAAASAEAASRAAALETARTEAARRAEQERAEAAAAPARAAQEAAAAEQRRAAQQAAVQRAARERAAAAAAAAAAARAAAVPPPPVVLEPGPGTLKLAIVPWGEVFVDGSSVGVSPPLTRLNLSAGSHSIEVHNGSAPPYSVRLEVEPGKTLSLQHRF